MHARVTLRRSLYCQCVLASTSKLYTPYLVLTDCPCWKTNGSSVTVFWQTAMEKQLLYTDSVVHSM